MGITITEFANCFVFVFIHSGNAESKISNAGIWEKNLTRALTSKKVYSENQSSVLEHFSPSKNPLTYGLKAGPVYAARTYLLSKTLPSRKYPFT